ncbi:MAG TPA: SDR family oxidoreductase [Candidatus Hydrogenedentes bacterium]|nr:SDR family oxidoreductase [Candidatus Hydrogenedentota bacterium]HIJ74153.1 SDR family oxidoreductase [Candidatus Hydrogenedentota bacterium]
MTLDGKVALITGSTGNGMGRSTAFTLANRGADIVLNYGTNRGQGEASADEFASEQFDVPAATSEDEVDKAARMVMKAIQDLGRRAVLVKADTKKEEAVAAMVEKAVGEFGKIDILVNNACGAWDIRDYTKIDFEHWKEVLSAEIDGAFLTMKHIVPGMRKRRWGRIVNIGLNGVLRMDSTKHVAPDFCLGKAARAWMTTAFGLREFCRGITVNCIEPGLIPHMTFEDALDAAKGDCAKWKQRESAVSHDIAEIIAFLCSEAGRFVSGSTIRVPC